MIDDTDSSLHRAWSCTICMHLAHSMELSASMCAEETHFCSIQYLKLGDDDDLGPGMLSPGSDTVADPAAPPNTPMKSSSTGRLPFERYGAQKAWFGSSGTISMTPRTPPTGLDGGASGGCGGSPKGAGAINVSGRGAGERLAAGIVCARRTRKWEA
jgi:hypothetical protein